MNPAALITVVILVGMVFCLIGYFAWLDARARSHVAWRDAVEDALIVDFIDDPDAWSDPRKALSAVVQCATQQALDPAISEAAQALIERGRESMQDAYAGAREDLEGWKRRALVAEADCRLHRSRISWFAAMVRAPLGVLNISVEEEADALIARAEKEGKVVVIETKPLQPLAMGHYKMVADVRDARVRAEPIQRSCAKAPEGWQCMRSPGHEGPCAAYPTHEVDQ